MIVIKYGGHALPEAGAVDPILAHIANCHKAGEKLVLVHGGGPQINAELKAHDIQSEFVGGYRKTTPETFEIVQRVLSGGVLRTLVNQLIGAGVNAIGISAADGSTIRATTMKPIVDGVASDIGMVGQISAVNPVLLNQLLQADYLPVVSPVACDDFGNGLNLNADLVAGALGGALTSDQVIFMTDVSGIYRNYPDPASLIETISVAELKELLPTFSEGMIPKVESAISAIEAGANSARIIDGRDIKNLVAALDSQGGTLVTP